MNKILVWDLPERLFHWLLVVLVIVSLVSAKIGGNAMQYHLLSGYTVLSLVLFRILWGFLGGAHARFSSFVRGPAAVNTYLRGLIRSRKLCQQGTDIGKRLEGHEFLRIDPLRAWG